MPHTKENYVRKPFSGIFTWSMFIDEATARFKARIEGRTPSSGAHPASEVINTHNELLSTLSDKNKSEAEREKAEKEFDRLYELNFSSFQRLHELEKQYFDFDLAKIYLRIEQNKYRERKEGVLSTITWHLTHKRAQSLVSFLMIIGFSLTFGIVMGLISLSPAMLLPSLIFVAVGCIGPAVATIIAILDQKHSVKKFNQIEHEMQELTYKRSVNDAEISSLVFSEIKKEPFTLKPIKPIVLIDEREKLRASLPEFYTQDQLVDMIAQGTLDAERRTLEADLKHVKEEMDRLTSRKRDLDQQKSLEKDAEKLDDLKLEWYDLYCEIDEKKVKMITLEKRIEELNTKAQAIEQKNKDGNGEVNSPVQGGEKNSAGNFFRPNVSVTVTGTAAPNKNPTYP